MTWVALVFSPQKNLGAIGDGGAISCNDVKIRDRLRGLRQYGCDENRISHEPGINSRLDELQAAILRVKLRHLDTDNGTRGALADTYNAELDGLSLECPVKRDGSKHIYHLYVLQVEKRDALIQFLKKQEIIASIHYPLPVHHMPAFKTDDYLPVTEQLSNRIVSLPLYPGFHEHEQKKVIESIKCFYKQEKA